MGGMNKKKTKTDEEEQQEAALKIFPKIVDSLAATVSLALAPNLQGAPAIIPLLSMTLELPAPKRIT